MDAGKRGETWSPSASTAELDARAARSAAPEPTGPPGDAKAGAAKARAALSTTRGEAAPRKGREELRDQPRAGSTRTTALGPIPSSGGEAARSAGEAAPRKGREELRAQPRAGSTRTTALGPIPSSGGEAARSAGEAAPRKGREELRAQPRAGSTRTTALGPIPSSGGEAARSAGEAAPRKGREELRAQPRAGSTRTTALGPIPSSGGEAASSAGEAAPRKGREELRAQPQAGSTRTTTTGPTPSPGGEAAETTDDGRAAKPAKDARAATAAKDGQAATAANDRRAAQNVATTAPTTGWGAAPDMGAPATFVLLRHGETPLTPQKRFSGSGGSDPSLSDVGREQAERVAAALAARGTIQAIVASPLARTRETAGAVADRLGLEVVVEDGLRETDFGAWEGLTFAEVRERHPEDLNTWLASPEAEPTGGGESFAATAHRMAATRDKLIASYAGRTVLLVTHVTPIKTLVRLALGAPPESLFRMELSAASLSAVAYYADGNASVRLFNDTSHLR
ncbi:bifunctional RNase H/acid phosphatase [Streptomyces sp. NBC_00647]